MWVNWPTTWVLFAPLVMLACMAGVFHMMRGTHARRHSSLARPIPDVTAAEPHETAHFPTRHSLFDERRADTVHLDHKQGDRKDLLQEELRAAEDKNEFDKFMAQLSQKASNIAVEGDAHGR
jgi:hypothetical protein